MCHFEGVIEYLMAHAIIILGLLLIATIKMRRS